MRRGLGQETGANGVRKAGAASNDDSIREPNGGLMLPEELRPAPSEGVCSGLIIFKAGKAWTAIERGVLGAFQGNEIRVACFEGTALREQGVFRSCVDVLAFVDRVCDAHSKTDKGNYADCGREQKEQRPSVRAQARVVQILLNGLISSQNGLVCVLPAARVLLAGEDVITVLLLQGQTS